MKMHDAKLLQSWLFGTPRTVAHQTPLSIELSRQEYWSGLPSPSPGDLPNPGIEPISLVSPALEDRYFTTLPHLLTSLHGRKDKGTVQGFILTESESESEVTQLCRTLCDPTDCSPPGSSVHGILQARILEWIAISFSRGSSWCRDRTQVSRIAGRCFNLWATREAPHNGVLYNNKTK